MFCVLTIDRMDNFHDAKSCLSNALTSHIFCSHPFDVIRTKMQSSAMESTISTASSSASATASTSTNNGPLQVVSHTLKNGGIRALYTGLALPLAAQAVYKATVCKSKQRIDCSMDEVRWRRWKAKTCLVSFLILCEIQNAYFENAPFYSF